MQALKARLQGMDRSRVPADPQASASDDTSAIARARADVNALLARRQDIRRQIAALQGAVDHMPRTEQELATLTRDFDQLRESYQAVLRRKMDAKMAGRLQQRWTEDFEILDQARLPERHVFPNRPLFIIGGLLAGLFLGIGAALLAEILSPLRHQSRGSRSDRAGAPCSPSCPWSIGRSPSWPSATWPPGAPRPLGVDPALVHDAHSGPPRTVFRRRSRPGSGSVSRNLDPVVGWLLGSPFATRGR